MERCKTMVFVVVPKPASGTLTWLERLGNPHIVQQGELVAYVGEGERSRARVLVGEMPLCFSLSECHSTYREAQRAADKQNRQFAKGLEQAAKQLRSAVNSKRTV